MELVSYIPGTIASIVLFQLTSHPNSKVKSKLPDIKFYNLQFSPNFRIHVGKKTIHFHHWMNCAIFLAVSIPINSAFMDATFTKGFMIGGILHGLQFSDALKIMYDNHQQIKT